MAPRQHHARICRPRVSDRVFGRSNGALERQSRRTCGAGEMPSVCAGVLAPAALKFRLATRRVLE